MTYSELIKLLRSGTTPEQIDEKREEIAEIIPEVRNMFDFDQKSKYQNYDVWLHCVHTVVNLPKDLDDDLVYLGALLHDIGKPYTQQPSKDKDDEEGEMVYDGHDKKGLEILNSSVLPALEAAGVKYTEAELSRIRYYVGEHHAMPGFSMKKFLRKQMMQQTFGSVVNLMQLQLADCHAQKKYMASVDRANFCKYIVDKSEREQITVMASGGFFY